MGENPCPASCFGWSHFGRNDMPCTIIDPSKHLIRNTRAADYFRRVLKFPDIVTFFNMETGQWILAYWINRQKHMVDEMEDLGVDMEVMQDTEFVNSMCLCWGGVDWKAKKRRMLDAEKKKETEKVEDLIQDQERWDWAKKRLQDRAPVPYMLNPYCTGGDTV